MSTSDGRHILLVEDSSLTAEQLCEMIRKHLPDVKCSVVASEKRALKVISTDTFRVVILDLRLKDGTGFNVLKKLSSLTPKPFTIVLTNYALPQYRDYALLAGADYFLDKATSIEALPTLLDWHFESRPGVRA